MPDDQEAESLRTSAYRLRSELTAAALIGAFDMRPAAEQNLEIVIADGKGNKVFRQTLKTSGYGVAAADFQLAGQVNTGAYKITAALGNASSEKTVTVEHYVLPKFKIELSTERRFYLPGEHVRGTLSAKYFFGKPVAEGAVALEGATFDVERKVAVNLQGATDAGGNFTFEFDLPGFMAGSGLEGGSGQFYVQARVTDQAKQVEQASLALPVSRSRLVIEAVPEGGQIRPGVDNILYVLTSYPDGTPAETSLSLNLQGQPLTAQTGAYGLAAVHFTPNVSRRRSRSRPGIRAAALLRAISHSMSRGPPRPCCCVPSARPTASARP